VIRANEAVTVEELDEIERRCRGASPGPAAKTQKVLIRGAAPPEAITGFFPGIG
jgi:hypothetical protein